MTPELCKAARALLRLTQKEIAAQANVSTQTVADFERGARTPHPNNLIAIQTVFEGLGIMFIVENGRMVGLKKV